jgi:hypothetical protein
VLFDDARYCVTITTRTDLTAKTVVACANACCDQENIIGTAQELGQHKSGVAALRVALRPDQPSAYMVIATLPWHIKGPASR